MTKYLRQLNRAKQLIIKYGTTCNWYKPGVEVGNDPTPEFPELQDAAEFDAVPIVTYTVKRQSEGTIVYSKEFETGVANLYASIPGDVPFSPEIDDAVLFNGKLMHVNYVNTTQPDGTAIVHEVGLR